jgi:predicted transcriptional regulator of viral defense system
MAIKSKTPKPLDWAKVLTNEARLTDVVLVDAIAAKYGLPAPSVWKAVSRLADRGLLSRVAKGVYLNGMVRDSAAEDFIRLLRPNSYVSLESALSHWGLSTQSCVALTCVTTGKPKEYRTPEFAITFRTISKRLFWGFLETQTRYSKYAIAEREKALLDWIYLCLQGGVTPSLDEIDFKSVDKQKLVKYVGKYPGTVRNVLTHSLAFEHFAVRTETESNPSVVSARSSGEGLRR